MSSQIRTDEPLNSPHGDGLNLAYAAGIFDGEGCVLINMTKPSTMRQARSPRYVLLASIANTDRLLLERFVLIFGGSIQARTSRNPNHLQGWTWYITSNQAQIFLVRIQPYLLIKYRQVALGLEFQSHVRERAQHSPHKQLTEDEIALRESFRMAISFLNQRKAVPL